MMDELMLDDIANEDETWEPLPDVPPRSLLYPLRPIGINAWEGGIGVESLTGYIARLAREHCLPTGVVVRDYLSPVLTCMGVGGRQATSLQWKMAHLIDGTGDVARDTTRLLCGLTGRADLDRLSMLPWAGAIPARSLLRRKRAWCPDCYRAWEASGIPAYDPLIWTIEAVTACHRHHRPLRALCPNPRCRRAVPVLAFRASPGRCAHCGVWLGEEDARDEGEAQGDEGMREHVARAAAVAELLASTATMAPLSSRENVAHAVGRLTRRGVEGRVPNIARTLDLSPGTLQSWYQGRRLPTLPALLHLSAGLGLSPLAFLTGAEELTASISPRLGIERGEDGGRTASPPETGAARARWARFDTFGVRQHLEAVLDDPHPDAPSMASVARDLGYYHQDLQARFPSLCAAISARYRADRTRRARARRRALGEEVRAVTLRLHADGVYPSEGRVAAALWPRGDFRTPEVRAAWVGAMADLAVPLQRGTVRGE